MKINWFTRKWNRLVGVISKWYQERKTQINWLRYWRDARQRHHDLYVFLYRQHDGKLDDKDMVEYKLAKAREDTGEVKPLPENATTPFG